MKKSSLFVIDTNTIISAFIFPDSQSRKALTKARDVGQIILSEATLNEFKDVFVRPKFDRYIPLKYRLEAIDDFVSFARFVEPKETILACRDPKDDKFLELAFEAAAICIITGDQDLLVLNPFRNIPIITASNFLSHFEL